MYWGETSDVRIGEGIAEKRRLKEDLNHGLVTFLIVTPPFLGKTSLLLQEVGWIGVNVIYRNIR